MKSWSRTHGTVDVGGGGDLGLSCYRHECDARSKHVLAVLTEGLIDGLCIVLPIIKPSLLCICVLSVSIVAGLQRGNSVNDILVRRGGGHASYG